MADVLKRRKQNLTVIAKPPPRPPPSSSSSSSTPPSASSSSPSTLRTKRPLAATPLSYFFCSENEWLLANTVNDVGGDVEELSVLSMNVWIREDGRELRMEALAALIADADHPHIVLLQEMTHLALQAMQSTSHTAFQAYTITSLDGQLSNYKTGLLIRNDLALNNVWLLDLPKIGRKAVAASISLDPNSPSAPPLLVASVHLSSEYSASPLRAAQLGAVQSHLYGLSSHPSPHILIAGDFNVHHEAEEQRLFSDLDLMDVWPSLHPERPGVTFPASHLRLDRIALALSPTSSSMSLTPTAMEVVGGDPIPALVSVLGEGEICSISDHAGMLARFTVHTPRAS